MRTLLSLMIAAAILIPVSASATHMDDVTFIGNCEGWSSEVVVTWGSAVGGELDWTVELLDADENVLETQEGVLPIEPTANPATYEFGSEWTASGGVGDYAIRWSVTFIKYWSGGQSAQETRDGLTDFSCGSVASESTSWTAIKKIW
jgi:hypothetical protein